MGPKPAGPRTDHDLFRTELVNLIDQRHELPKSQQQFVSRMIEMALAQATAR